MIQSPLSRRARDGVEGNARLTAGTAVVLLVLLAAEGITILRIWPLLGWHVAIGLLLVPPVLLKMASTGWRFARYYLGDPAYREKGPPAPVLRWLGPFVVALTALLFGSGVGLLVSPNAFGGRLLTLHQASFVLWFVATAVHVLGHLVDTARLAPRDWMPRSRRRAPGAGARIGLVVLALIVGALIAAAFTDAGTAHFRKAYTRHASGVPSSAIRPPPAATA